MKKRLAGVAKFKVCVSLFGVVALAPLAQAADRTKANNADNLNLATSWLGGALPGAGDVAVWNSIVTAANSALLGTDLSWQGIRIADPSGNVTIDGGNTLTLGYAGINATTLSNSREFHLFNSKLVLAADQEWTFSGWNNAEIGNTTSDEIDTAGHTLNVRNGASIFKSAITGAGGLTKSGNGQLQLLATSTYTGTTDIQGGILMIGNGFGGGKLDAASVITGAGTGTLQLNKKNGVGYVMHNIITGDISVQVRTGDIRVSAASDYTGATTIEAGASLTVNGTITNSAFVVDGVDALLGGAGRVGTVSFGADGGKLAPGNLLVTGYGTLDTGDLDMASAGTASLELMLGGSTAGLDYDRVRVAGTVNLADAELNISLASGYTPSDTNTFILVDNDEADAITGTFSGLAEGASVVLGGVDFTISYVGGDGNDAILSVPVPLAADITSFDIVEDASGLVATVGFEGTGSAYALQFRNSLVVGDWLTVATGVVSPLVYTNSSADTVGFYQLGVE